MNRYQYTLYVNNISDLTHEDDFISLFKKFGNVESYTFLTKTSQRKSAAAIITYSSSVDVNAIIQRGKHIIFNNRTLLLRHMLPPSRKPYEFFILSKELVVSSEYSNEDKQFNEINIQKYFSKYGRIMSCRTVIPYKKYLISFMNTNNVDCAILDEPHLYNETMLKLQKYTSPMCINLIHSKDIFCNENEENTKFSGLEKIRRLKHVIEALEFAQQVQIELIKYTYETKRIKQNKNHNDDILILSSNLRKKCGDISTDIKRMKTNNSFFKSKIEQIQLIKAHIVVFYEKKIENQQNRANQLKEAINLISIF